MGDFSCPECLAQLQTVQFPSGGSPSPLPWVKVSQSLGSEGQDSGERSLKTCPTIRVSAYGHSRLNLPVSRQSLQGTELKVWVGLSVRLWICVL